MLPSRKGIVSIVALLSVMLHAYALVAHNASMLRMGQAPPVTASQSVFERIAALSIFCRAGDPAGLQSFTNLANKDAPTPSTKHGKATNACPICSGIATASFIEPPPAIIIERVAGQTAIGPSRHIAVTYLTRAALPPARGPPLST